ncbi:MAG: hypothetical protein ABIO60_00950 [Aquaticitalea sp.]
MKQFDTLFFSVFEYYKTKYKAKANDLALIYILLLQTSFLLAFGTFFLLFFSQMHVNMMSPSKAWTLFIIAVIILTFRNWMYFTGKKRKVLNTKKTKKSEHKNMNIWVLWSFPIVLFIISVLLMLRL